MRRPWRALWPLLVTLAIGLFAPDAEAMRVPRCACPERVVLPKLGSTNVPLNTKLWVIDHTGAPGSAETSLHVSPVAGESALEPNTEYSPEGTRFTTGTAPDTTPPAAPADVDASIVVLAQPAERMPIDAITLWGTYDADTAMIKIELWDGERTTTFYTTPRRRYVCSPGARIRPGVIRVTLRAVDLAGNESPPVETTTVAESTAGPSATTDNCGEQTRAMAENRHFRCGTGDLAVLFLIPVVAIGILIGIVVVRLLRNAKIRRTPPVEVGLVVAEAVIRMMMRGQLIASALGLVAMGVALTFDSRPLAFMLGVIPLVCVSNWGSCRVALHRLARIDAVAERRNTWLIVRDRSGETSIRATDRVFRAVVRSELATAAIKRG